MFNDTPNFPISVLVANAFYVKQTDILDYEQLKEYKKILYQTLIKKYKYVMFNDQDGFWPYPNRVDETDYEINGELFIKLNDGIYHFSKGDLNEEWINKVNYYYSSDIKKLFKESWQKYANIEEKKVQKQKIKK